MQAISKLNIIALGLSVRAAPGPCGHRVDIVAFSTVFAAVFSIVITTQLESPVGPGFSNFHRSDYLIICDDSALSEVVKL